ncbi:hypothetical protein [Pseudooceanicola marinus]|uniref:hypothetical protein n=1 Tax=Pseudooceanicola marinus TaxID=396013 RepID=UPI001CD5AF66|nr:hypothetical protein [Pseudooceanicola marinus]MCA1337379.1 hypothetical protein [Pseudooceanicola marinus]
MSNRSGHGTWRNARQQPAWGQPHQPIPAPDHRARASGTALLTDHDEIRAFLDRVTTLHGQALREAFMTQAIEGGGTFAARPNDGGFVVHLHRIPCHAHTEAGAIALWIQKAREILGD